MNWNRFQTYGDSPTQSFETLCNQIFERFLRRTYTNDLIKFRAINGAGGDGGIEAYGLLQDRRIIAVQSKWFPNGISDQQIKQIRQSVYTALELRPNISEYIICIPRNISSTKFVRGKNKGDKKPALNTEEKLVDDFIDEIAKQFPKLQITWWFDQDLLNQIQAHDNDGLHKYWFDREILAINYLKQQFDLQKSGWLKERYKPELHGQGFIQDNIESLLFQQHYRAEIVTKLFSETKSFFNAKDIIIEFLSTLKMDDHLLADLNTLLSYLENCVAAISTLAEDIDGGFEHQRHSFELDAPILVFNRIIIKIQNLAPSNIQLNYKERLINELNQVRQNHISDFLSALSWEALQIGRLFLGDAGTGKTHALSNTVEKHLKHFSPAIIIRAKGSPSDNWTKILEAGLEISGWNRNEMLSALETLATRADRFAASTLKPGEENANRSKVIICIDGLEEDLHHWNSWHDRMLETSVLAEQYPTIKFVFTSRGYFLNNNKIKTSTNFHILNVPREGDIPIDSIKDKYFSPTHYNITITPPLKVKGLDSLFALRLFCEEYENKTLANTKDFIYAERLLLRKKIDRLENEFKEVRSPRISNVQSPIKTTLNIISDYFYNNDKISHSDLLDILKPTLGQYLDVDEIDDLIAYLSMNGIITKSEIPRNDLLGNIDIFYQISYQSIMEIITADKYTNSIISGEIMSLPEHLILEQTIDEIDPNASFILNQKIAENVVTTLFNEHQKMIGEDNFLTDNLTQNQIEYLQLKALGKATPELSVHYESIISSRFLSDYKKRAAIFGTLIIPSANSSDMAFGAQFLDKVLREINKPFDRDLVWMGWDTHEIYKHDESEETFRRYDLQQILIQNDILVPLPNNANHNELPLIYAWSLSTLNQKFRSQLRIELLKWALLLPKEFALLLDKIFNCGDPQIQEDLASITLGLATKLKDLDAHATLAHWALENVFANLNMHRNIIVREGFRAIVERAYQYKIISDDEVKLARPVPRDLEGSLELDLNAVENSREEIYPIVHDLAWYVIERSFNKFLDYGDEDDIDLKPELKFLHPDNSDLLGPYNWAIAAAIAYMKDLGFSRISGNSFTEATHGSKSENFTLEEKYVWLAVHYIQGFLADHLPLKDTGEYILSYSQLENIPNPADTTQDFSFRTDDDYSSKWIIPESLTEELDHSDNFDQLIDSAVKKEPTLNLERWIKLDGQQLTGKVGDQSLIALYNYTSIHDSKKYISSRLHFSACLISKGQSKILKKLLEKDNESLYIFEDIDSLHASPKTSTYSNSSDLVWMKWIGEIDSSSKYYDETADEDKLIEYTLTKVVSETNNGEEKVIIPSLKIRDLLKIVNLENGVMTDINGNTKALVFKNGRNSNYDTQEMVIVNEEDLISQLNKNDLELVWIAELLTSKNALNDAIKSDIHPQRVRKYLITISDGNYDVIKFWDYRFSNSKTYE